jgi:MYXO-CTERM domain-containing protein
MVRTLSQRVGVGLVVMLVPVPAAHAVDCFFDSVDGMDESSGLTEEEARQDYTNVPSTCTVAKYKRGSQWNLASGDTLYPPKKGGGTTYATSKIKTLTNYGDASLPLPRFVKQREWNNGGMISAMQGGVTIDGIYMAGAMSDAQMANIAQGICIFAGGNMKILNNEIADCDLGMMLAGEGSLVQGNYVHDLHVVVDAPPGVDPNLVGGAEGIFINGSNNEVAYNSFIDCSDHADWTGGNCDGGATEVSIGGSGGIDGGGLVTGVKIHHNLAVNTCGFFEVSSMGNLGSGTEGKRGTFSDSAFYNNVIIDSGWLSLLQVSNTDLRNIRWENNTLVQHKGSVNSGIAVVVYTACSSGMCGGALGPDQVYWTNNIFAFDGVPKPAVDKNIVQISNIMTTTDPGFVNFKGTNDPNDFQLTAAATDAIDKATPLDEITLDFLNNPVPETPDGKPDIGAFEYNSTGAATPPPTFPGTINPSHGNLIGKGGQGGTTVVRGTGGASGRGGTTGGTTGGTVPVNPGTGDDGGLSGTGGSQAGRGGATGSGGSTSTMAASGGTTSTPKGSGGAAGGTTSSQPPASGGTQGSGGDASGGTRESTPAGDGGAQGAGGDTGQVESSSSNGCSCDVGRGQHPNLLWPGLLGLALLIRQRRRG